MFDLNYFNDADRYELDYAERTEDIKFYLALAKKHLKNKKAAHVLEIGCGSGRISIPIAKNSFNITGIDLSKELLKKGAKKALEHKVNIDFIEADFRSFNIKNKNFDFIFAPFNTLQHAYTDDDFMQMLAQVSKHLKQGGVFAFDINNINSNDFKRKTDDIEVFDVFKAYNKDGVLNRYVKGQSPKFAKNDLIEVIVEDEVTYSDDKKFATYRLFYSTKLESDFIVAQITHRIFKFVELKCFLKLAGFKVLNVYGDFNKEPYNRLNSPSILIVASLI